MKIAMFLLILVVQEPTGEVAFEVADAGSMDNCVHLIQLIDNDYRIQREEAAKLKNPPPRRELITGTCIKVEKKVELL